MLKPLNAIKAGSQICQVIDFIFYLNTYYITIDFGTNHQLTKLGFNLKKMLEVFFFVCWRPLKIATSYYSVVVTHRHSLHTL